MSEAVLSILQNPTVMNRTSAATRRALQERAAAATQERFLAPALYAVLQQIVDAIVPQGATGAHVDIAAMMDKRLADGTGDGWRFADLPADGEAYARGLAVFAAMLEQTPMKAFERMPVAAREGYLRCVANGDVDGPAGFALSKWLLMVKTDAVRAFMSHPATMETMEYYGFADGATGLTDGPTAAEGWQQITTNKALPFEMGLIEPVSSDGGAA